MVQTMKNVTKQPRLFESTPMPQPRTLVIAYEQPKVVVVRNVTRTIVPHVNPNDYQRRFDSVLLDTPTLLAITRRLNIRDGDVSEEKNITFKTNFRFV